MQSVIIRKYQPGDLTQITQLFRDTVHAVNQYDHNSVQLQAWAPNELDMGKWAKSLAEHITYVAVLDYQIVGLTFIKNCYIIQL